MRYQRVGVEAMLQPSKDSACTPAWHSLCAIVLVTSAWACQPQGPEPSVALEQADPYLDAFWEFARWSRRAPVANTAMSGPAALSEAVFAPLQLDPRVRGAWVRWGSHAADELTHPPGVKAPDDLPWVAVRHARWGTLRVAWTSRCPGGDEDGCVWLARRASHGASRELRVMVAYRDSGALATR